MLPLTLINNLGRKTMEFNIKKLPKINLGNYQQLPDYPGIYFACDAAHRVWYVGISTSSLRSRHQTHEKLVDFQVKKVQWICYHMEEDAEKLLVWEQENIEKYNPPLNSHHITVNLPIIDLKSDPDDRLNRYRELVEMKKAIEAEIEQLKPDIVSIVEARGGKYKTDSFSVSLTSKKIWKYSPAVDELKDELKILQREEEAKGIAIVESTSIYPTFRLLNLGEV
jgi:hypothetical protein